MVSYERRLRMSSGSAQRSRPVISSGKQPSVSWVWIDCHSRSP